jgi:hypothetical protein
MSLYNLKQQGDNLLRKGMVKGKEVIEAEFNKRWEKLQDLILKDLSEVLAYIDLKKPVVNEEFNLYECQILKDGYVPIKIIFRYVDSQGVWKRDPTFYIVCPFCGVLHHKGLPESVSIAWTHYLCD